MTERETAKSPEDLLRLFIERGNAGDVEGLLALYEPDAVVAVPPGRETTGHEALRAVYTQLLAKKPKFDAGTVLPVLRSGDYALTTARTGDGGARAEVAHRQPDGTWLWIIDRPFFG
ncbi:YybH family protein [Streptomyces sp. NPDC003753]|uniref:YybH family protein n=1 Tax=unclassified Streptomyces TaxID=2593676 RepID=UPI0019041F6A|nr:nuclear transport factor 2 family protein [Streptomyces sp. Y2F8-2]GHJ98966.1 hypothetical protein SY2F82_07640 [Streptomyces sp. Y2F8-2]